MTGSEFKKLCKEKKLTASMIEEKTGIKKRTIYSYFSGSRSPNKATRQILREKLGINTEEYFG